MKSNEPSGWPGLAVVFELAQLLFAISVIILAAQLFG